MYWLTSKNNLFRYCLTVGALALTVSFYSCSNKQESIRNPVASELDIPYFFEKEIEKLQQENVKVVKTVYKDTISETKTLQINKWATELASFSNVDINKAAYRNTFTKDSTDNKVTYTFNTPKVDLLKVEIAYTNGKPTDLIIQRSAENLLYTTREVLRYTTGKSYSIEKMQSVRILGTSKYKIEGQFLP